MLVGLMFKFWRVVDVGTVSCSCHSAPNDVSCMCISLNVSEFHTGHHIVWNMDIVGHKNM